MNIIKQLHNNINSYYIESKLLDFIESILVNSKFKSLSKLGIKFWSKRVGIGSRK